MVKQQWRTLEVLVRIRTSNPNLSEDDLRSTVMHKLGVDYTNKDKEYWLKTYGSILEVVSGTRSKALAASKDPSELTGVIRTMEEALHNLKRMNREQSYGQEDIQVPAGTGQSESGTPEGSSDPESRPADGEGSNVGPSG